MLGIISFIFCILNFTLSSHSCFHRHRIILFNHTDSECFKFDMIIMSLICELNQTTTSHLVCMTECLIKVHSLDKGKADGLVDDCISDREKADGLSDAQVDNCMHGKYHGNYDYMHDKDYDNDNECDVKANNNICNIKANDSTHDIEDNSDGNIYVTNHYHWPASFPNSCYWCFNYMTTCCSITIIKGWNIANGFVYKFPVEIVHTRITSIRESLTTLWNIILIVVQYLTDVLILQMQLYAKFMQILLECSAFYNITPFSIAKMCFLIKLKLMQNIFRKHDFLTVDKYKRNNVIVANGIGMLITFLLVYFQGWKGVKLQLGRIKNVLILILIIFLYYQNQTTGIWNVFGQSHNKNTPLDASCTYEPDKRSTFNLFKSDDIQSTTSTKSSQSYMGGGKLNEFSYEQLKPYVLTKSSFEDHMKLKFTSYMLKDETSLHSTESSICVNDDCLKVITPKLTIVSLKIITANHNIYFHSKMNHKTLQSAIEDHVCDNCATCISIFELVDNVKTERQKILSHKATIKESKARNQQKYQKQKLAAVKKYQLRYGTKHREGNNVAVSKYKTKNPEKHQAQHQAAVYKFNIENPEKHKDQNQAAVKKFKLENPKKHQAQHQAAIYKFNIENPEKNR